MRVRTYRELRRLDTFNERFDYLLLAGSVGQMTFGFDRYINQAFYRSAEWKYVRNEVIARDDGCDLGVPGYEIHADILVHHMNPMSADDIVHDEEWILDPNYLITTTTETHNAIHYGGRGSLRVPYSPREPGDTRLWG